MSPRSRLWWKKTERLARIPPGSLTPAETTTDVITTESAEPLLTEFGQSLVTES